MSLAGGTSEDGEKIEKYIHIVFGKLTRKKCFLLKKKFAKSGHPVFKSSVPFMNVTSTKCNFFKSTL
jgi:hypothetical protein